MNKCYNYHVSLSVWGESALFAAWVVFPPKYRQRYRRPPRQIRQDRRSPRQRADPRLSGKPSPNLENAVLRVVIYDDAAKFIVPKRANARITPWRAMKTGGIAFLRFSPALTPGIDDPGRSPLGEAYRPPHLCHCGFPKMTKRRENPSTLWFLLTLCRPERSRGVSGSNQVSGNREIPRLRWERQGKQPPQSGNPLSDRSLRGATRRGKPPEKGNILK